MSGDVGRIRAITFDFWNTLYGSLGGEHVAAARAELLRQHFASHGLGLAPARIRAAYSLAEARLSVHRQTDRLCPKPEQAVEDIHAALDIAPSAGAAERLLELFRSTEIHKVEPLPGVREALAELATQYRLGVVSDTWLTLGRFIRGRMAEHALDRFFRVMVFSDETGYMKPHSYQFQLALAELGVRPDEAVHIGDTESTDVRGAKLAGMKSVLLSLTANQQETAADAVVRGPDEIVSAVHRLER